MASEVKAALDSNTVIDDNLTAVRTAVNHESSRASVGTGFQMKSEAPVVPSSVETAFAQLSGDMLAAGNQSYTIELKEHGKLGLFLKRPATKPKPVLIYLDPASLYFSCKATLLAELNRLSPNKNGISNEEFASRAELTADKLATGCSLIAYLKMRNVLVSELPFMYTINRLKKPRAGADLPIPAPFAFAFQQLGAVSVADLPYNLRLIPAFPETGHKFGIPTVQTWNPRAYATAVEYARGLGMRFNAVDLKVKNGTAWWLLRQVYEEDVFELTCPLPEANFTDAMAVTHSLFLLNTPDDPSQPFVDLSRFNDDNYGTILRNPHAGINLSTFEALSDV